MDEMTRSLLKEIWKKLSEVFEKGAPGLGTEVVRRIAVASTLRELAKEVERGQVSSFKLDWDGGDNVDVKKGLSNPAEFIKIALESENPK